MPDFFYGDSYGQVGQQALAYDAARDRRYSDSLANLRANAALQLQAQVAQQEAGYRNAALQAQLAERAADNAARDRAAQVQQSQFGQEFGARAGQNDIGNRLALLQILAQGGRVADAKGDKDYQEALQALTQGALPIDKVQSKFPNLDPTQRARLNDYYDTLSGQEAQARAALMRDLPDIQDKIKAIMGQPEQLKKKIRLLNQQAVQYKKVGDKTLEAQIQDRLLELDKPEDLEKLAQRRMNAILADKQLNETYNIDPITGNVRLKRVDPLFPARSVAPVKPPAADAVAPPLPGPGAMAPPPGGWGVVDPGRVPLSAAPPPAIRPVRSMVEKQTLRVMAERAIRDGKRDPVAVARIFQEQTGEPLF